MSNITFDETTHTYMSGDKKLISVTQLLRKHEITPSYEFVKPEILQASADKGKVVHEEIENYVKNGEIGFTEEFGTFVDLMDRYELTPVDAEQIVYNDVVAGTYDLLAKTETGAYVLVDHKTTSTLHKTAVQWQLSIYAYLLKKCRGIEVANIAVIHYPTKSLTSLPMIAEWRIEELMQAERDETKLPSNIDSHLLKLATEAELYIIECENAYKQAKEIAEHYRKQLLQAMQEHGYKSFETDTLKLTVKDGYERESIDSAKLKKELPEIAEQYKKVSTVGASLIVKVKNNGES